MRKFVSKRAPESFLCRCVYSIESTKVVSSMVEIKIDKELCTGCGTCVDTCPVEVFEIQDEKSVVVNVDECLVCLACETQCPEGAIKVIE